MQWALRARELAQKDDSLPAYIRKHWLEEVNHRLERLEKKSKKGNRGSLDG
jgi:hypothetical protein